MSNTNQNQSEIDENSNLQQQENLIFQQRTISNNLNPRIRQRQSSVLFRILMIYFITLFFRRPTTVHSIVNRRLSINNPSISNTVSMRENLYTTSDSLTSEGTYMKFIEFPISENIKNNGSGKKADDNVVEPLSHWHSNITINLLDDQSL
ncbi:unnamed protein product [Rotaria sordida]|uniref:Uncharacterized protein n=1 Tax=Rotaria sordida TaxID=392033 RepID=A0A819FT84_9BILA|nr:unnamed protein product [Rotaria sordida]